MTEDELNTLFALAHELTHVECKRSGALTNGRFVAKVVRAILGMSNRRDGGVVIVGVEEAAGRRLPAAGAAARAGAPAVPGRSRWPATRPRPAAGGSPSEPGPRRSCAGERSSTTHGVVILVGQHPGRLASGHKLAQGGGPPVPADLAGLGRRQPPAHARAVAEPAVTTGEGPRLGAAARGDQAEPVLQGTHASKPAPRRLPASVTFASIGDARTRRLQNTVIQVALTMR